MRTRGREGVQKSQNFADVLYVWSPREMKVKACTKTPNMTWERFWEEEMSTESHPRLFKKIDGHEVSWALGCAYNILQG